MKEKSIKIMDGMLRGHIEDAFILSIALKLNSDLVNIEMGGYNLETIASAIIYLAYRKAKQPKSLDDISRITNINRTDIGHVFSKLTKELGTRYCKEAGASLMGNGCMIIPSPIQYAKPIFEKLNLSEKVSEDVVKILDKYCNELYGRSPLALLGAAIYVASALNNEKKTQRELSIAVGCSEVTIRNVTRLVISKLDVKERDFLNNKTGRILSILEDKLPHTTKEIIERTGLTKLQIRGLIKSLRQQNYDIESGHRKGGYILK